MRSITSTLPRSELFLQQVSGATQGLERVAEALRGDAPRALRVEVLAGGAQRDAVAEEGARDVLVDELRHGAALRLLREGIACAKDTPSLVMGGARWFWTTPRLVAIMDPRC